MNNLKKNLSYLEICKIHTEGSGIITSIKSYLQRELDSGISSIPISKQIFSLDYKSLESFRIDICNCHRCALAKTRTNIVFGHGNNDAKLLFIGDIPSAEDDKDGIPFIDDAGLLLTKIIKSIGLTRDDVYLCNVLKCYNSKESSSLNDEIIACRDFLSEQIRLIQPEIILCLGFVPAQVLLQTNMPLDKLRGKFHQLILNNRISVVVTYHPRTLLLSPEKKILVWEDMKMLKSRLNLP